MWQALTKVGINIYSMSIAAKLCYAKIEPPSEYRYTTFMVFSLSGGTDGYLH